MQWNLTDETIVKRFFKHILQGAFKRSIGIGEDEGWSLLWEQKLQLQKSVINIDCQQIYIYEFLKNHIVIIFTAKELWKLLATYIKP